MSDPAEVLDGAVIEKSPRLLTKADAPQLVQANVVGSFLRFVPLGIAMRPVHRPLGDGVGLRLVHQVRNPGGDGLNDDLRAFALQEIEHVEVAVALRDLRPEFTGDFHHRFHLGAIDFDRVHALAGGIEGAEVVLAPHVLVPFPEDIGGVAENLVALEFRLGPIRCALFDLKALAVAQVLAQAVHGFVENTIGFALVHFVGADLINQVVEHIAQVHGIQHAEPEIDGELQPRLA